MSRNPKATAFGFCVFVVIGLVEAIGQNGDPPQIVAFDANRPQVREGDSLVFSWEVTGADSISLSGAGLDLITALPTSSHAITVPSGAGSAVYTSGTMVPLASTWRFHDGTDEFGTDWREPDFEEVGWDSGPGELGFGDGDEATVVGVMGLISVYFRKTFHVSGADPTLPLHITAKRDDGIVIYLNGQEIKRDKMPNGVIRFDTFAASLVPTPEEPLTVEFPLGNTAGLLREGENTLAASVHQFSPVSSDISFDIEFRYAGEVLPRENYTLTATNTHGTTTAEISVRVENRAGADGDNDRLPDAWEFQFFGALLHDANDDPDADGFPNSGELAAGTNPFDLQSFPDVPRSIAMIRNVTGIRLTTQSIFGARVGVQYSSDLSPGTWLDLGNFFETEESAIFIDPDQIRAARPDGYYRAFRRAVP